MRILVASGDVAVAASRGREAEAADMNGRQIASALWPRPTTTMKQK